MKKNYLLSMLIKFGIMVTVLVGCGNFNESGAGEDRLTLAFYHADGDLNMRFDDAVAEEIMRLTGVKLEILAPMAGDEAQDIALMISQGEFPDLIYAKGSLDLLIGADAVLPLDERIAEKGHHIKALYGDQLGRLRHTLDNPFIYHVGTFGVNERILETAGTAQIQMDVMRELGYPNLETLAELEEAIKTYLEKNPTINGQETIGLSLLGSDWRWLITVGNPAGFAVGLQDDGEWFINEATGEAIFKYLMPEFRAYFRWLNGMNAQGLLDSESFTHTPDTYFAKISSGRVLAVMDQGWNISETQTALVGDGEAWRTFMPLGVTLTEGIRPCVTRANGYTGGWGVSIASNSKHAEEAFDFLNWMASEEAQILVNWGIEGIHWEYVGGGFAPSYQK